MTVGCCQQNIGDIDMTSVSAPTAAATADKTTDDAGSKARGYESSASSEELASVIAFDYAREAELFPTRSRKPRRHAHTYRRFTRAAEAIRFAIEELPRDLLLGACLQVEDERFGSAGIRKLYDSDRYPLKRAAALR
jgi:hypothetical protein